MGSRPPPSATPGSDKGVAERDGSRRTGSEGGSIRLALELWGGRRGSIDQGLLDQLLQVLPQEGRRLVLETSLLQKGLSARRIADRLALLAHEAWPGKGHAAWRRLADARLSAHDTATAWHQMALLDLAEDRAHAAIPLLKKAVGESETVAPEAQWALGHAYFSIGEYEAALEAWRLGIKEWPRESCCGDSYVADEALWQGLALDHLGRYEEAVSHYLVVLKNPRVVSRLLDIYEGAGQFAAGARALTNRMKRLASFGVDMDRSMVVLVLRYGARARDWINLVAQVARATDDPFHEDDRHLDSSASGEAARLLALQCQSTVPFLLEALRRSDQGQGGGLLRVLGVCGTPPAIEALKPFAREPTTYISETARRALSLTQLGREALDQMGLRVAPPSRRPTAWRDAILFPAATPTKKLPLDLAPAVPPERKPGKFLEGCVCW